MTMRRLILLTSLLLLSSNVVHAADAPQDRWRVSILASEISQSRDPWSDVHAGLGVGIAYDLQPASSVEITVSDQSYRSPYIQLLSLPSAPGNQVVPVTIFQRYHVHPVDLTVSRQFRTASRLSPYVRAGARYVDAPDDEPHAALPASLPNGVVPIRIGFGFSDRASLEAGGGVRLWLTERTALRMEVMRLLRSERTDFDPLTRLAAGVTWRF